jgi:hypothetical protein
MERKVTEWGCMQALIDYDGWRKWKDYANNKDKGDAATREKEEKEEKAKSRAQLRAMFARPPPTVKKDETGEAGKDKNKEPEKGKEKDESFPSASALGNGSAVGGAGAMKKASGTGYRGHKSRVGSGTLPTTPEAPLMATRL